MCKVGDLKRYVELGGGGGGGGRVVSRMERPEVNLAINIPPYNCTFQQEIQNKFAENCFDLFEIKLVLRKMLTWKI